MTRREQLEMIAAAVQEMLKRSDGELNEGHTQEVNGVINDWGIVVLDFCSGEEEGNVIISTYE